MNILRSLKRSFAISAESIAIYGQLLCVDSHRGTVEILFCCSVQVHSFLLCNVSILHLCFDVYVLI